MGNRLDQKFEQLKKLGRKGLVIYLTAGDPDLPTSMEVARTVSEQGADVLELGVPFSDPLADGVVIQQASQRALAAGTRLSDILNHVRELRKQIHTPIVLFTYFNPVHHYGLERLMKEAVEAGVDGILFLDLPPEESAAADALFASTGLRKIPLIAPTTPPDRIPLICQNAGGFIYFISREGVTGMQSSVASSIQERVGAIREHSPLPVAVGFGISTPEQARQVAIAADAVVVGSALVNEVAKGGSPQETCRRAGMFCASLSRALKEVAA